MRTIEVDANQRELSPHGTLLYPLEINHDDLSTFQNGFVRCHWHEELELSIVRSGRACYTLGGGVHVLQAGEGILINANVPHTSAPFGSENAVLLTVIVHPAFLYGLPGSVIESRLMRPFLASRRLSAVPLTAEETQNVLAVDELAQRRSFAWELKSKSLLCDLFYSLLARSRDELCEDAPLSEEALARLDGMLAALHAHFGEALDLAALARQACLSREDCCRFFKRMTGQTISQYMETFRVAQSVPLLQAGEMSVTAVALQCGFSNAGRFSAAFSRRMHVTPKAFQRQCREHFILPSAAEKAES